MNRKLIFFNLMILVGVLLVACAPPTININVPTINPPQYGITLGPGTPSDGSSNTPTGGGSTPSTGAGTPAPQAPGNSGTDPVTMLFYGILALAGVALLIALLALMRRPDR